MTLLYFLMSCVQYFFFIAVEMLRWFNGPGSLVGASTLISMSLDNTVSACFRRALTLEMLSMVRWSFGCLESVIGKDGEPT
jgi:hypothetical protein